MTQKPKNILSLVFLTLLIGAFVSVLAVYVTGKYVNVDKDGMAPEQVINSALYGVMVSVIVCLVLNWCMDMETQFAIMIGEMICLKNRVYLSVGIQLVLSIASGFLFWWIFGFKIAYIAAM